MSEVFTLWQRFCMWFCDQFCGWYLARRYHAGMSEGAKNAWHLHQPLRDQLDAAESAVVAWQMKCHELDGLLEEVAPVLCDCSCPARWVTAEGQPHTDLCKKVRARMDTPEQYAEAVKE